VSKHPPEFLLEKNPRLSAEIVSFSEAIPVQLKKIYIFRGVLLVGLLIRRRDNVPTQFMGHDLKQFKSLEVSVTLVDWRIFNGSLLFIGIKLSVLMFVAR
jgi:hypothetical protein